MNDIFVHYGNAVILHDYQEDRYVGVAFCNIVDSEPNFASVSARVGADGTYEYCMLFLVDSLMHGLSQAGFQVTAPVVLRDCNRAVITGGGKKYAIGVSSGKLFYAYGAGREVPVAQLERDINNKMRCPDRE